MKFKNTKTIKKIIKTEVFFFKISKIGEPSASLTKNTREKTGAIKSEMKEESFATYPMGSKL